MAKASILYVSEFVCVFLAATPQDRAGVRHDAAYARAIDGTEKAFV